MPVVEIFTSLQGEGIHVGRLSTFIRLAGCNLHCVWCDTKYSNSKLADSETMTVDEIIKEALRRETKLVVITGGEPFLQKKELRALIIELKKMNFEVHIETNGTIFDKTIARAVDFISISPKLNSSLPECETETSKQPFDLFVLNSFVESLSFEKFQLKFVISKKHFKSDICDVRNILSKVNLSKDSNIVIHAESQSRNMNEFIRKNRFLVTDPYFRELRLLLADYSNTRILIQLHKFFWLNKKGV